MNFSDYSQALLLKNGSGALARHRGFSTRTLRRRLEDDGTTLRDFTDFLRARDAKKLLADGCSPTVVARAVGFATEQSFCRFCYRIFGATPSDIQRRLRRAAEMVLPVLDASPLDYLPRAAPAELK